MKSTLATIILNTYFGETIITLIIFILILILVRGFWLWYWKVNNILKNQQKTNELLEQIINVNISGKRYGKLEEGEVIVKNTLTSEVKKTTREKWEDLKAKHPGQTKFILLDEN